MRTIPQLKFLFVLPSANANVTQPEGYEVARQLNYITGRRFGYHPIYSIDVQQPPSMIALLDDLPKKFPVEIKRMQESNDGPLPALINFLFLDCYAAAMPEMYQALENHMPLTTNLDYGHIQDYQHTIRFMNVKHLMYQAKPNFLSRTFGMAFQLFPNMLMNLDQLDKSTWGRYPLKNPVLDDIVSDERTHGLTAKIDNIILDLETSYTWTGTGRKEKLFRDYERELRTQRLSCPKL